MRLRGGDTGMTHNVGPSSAVTASGSASVIHNTIISAMTAARAAPEAARAVGSNRISDRQQRRPRSSRTPDSCG